jgi:hypothetical protein
LVAESEQSCCKNLTPSCVIRLIGQGISILIAWTKLGAFQNSALYLALLIPRFQMPIILITIMLQVTIENTINNHNAELTARDDDIVNILLNTPFSFIFVIYPFYRWINDN